MQRTHMKIKLAFLFPPPTGITVHWKHKLLQHVNLPFVWQPRSDETKIESSPHQQQAGACVHSSCHCSSCYQQTRDNLNFVWCHPQHFHRGGHLYMRKLKGSGGGDDRKAHNADIWYTHRWRGGLRWCTGPTGDTHMFAHNRKSSLKRFGMMLSQHSYN